MEQLDPVEYPKIRLGEQEVEVRYTCGSIIRLKKELGFDLQDIKEHEVKGADAIERTCVFLAAGISHSVKMTVDQVADCIDLRDLPRYAAAINEALKKAAPQAEKKPAVN